MRNWINIALPKGRLGEKAYDIFEAIGYGCPSIHEGGRKLIFENEENGVRYFWVKPSDVAVYVERGAADMIQTIPGPVIGGISFLLYGMIGTSGLRILVDSKVDYGKNRNQALTAVIFVTGLSGIKVNFGNVQLTGMVLACVVGMILSLIFYIFDKMKFTNDQ